MTGNRSIILVAAAVALILPAAWPHPAGAHKATVPAVSGNEPTYCASLAGFIQKRLSEIRVLKAGVPKKDGPPGTVMEMFDRMAGTEHPSEAQRQQLDNIAIVKAQLVDFNERYKREACGTIDIEHEMALAPKPGDKPAEPKKKSKKLF